MICAPPYSAGDACGENPSRALTVLRGGPSLWHRSIVFDEATLLDKLRKIEALHAGATTDGERVAAAFAADRIRQRLADWRKDRAQLLAARPVEPHAFHRAVSSIRAEAGRRGTRTCMGQTAGKRTVRSAARSCVSPTCNVDAVRIHEILIEFC